MFNQSIDLDYLSDDITITIEERCLGISDTHYVNLFRNYDELNQFRLAISSYAIYQDATKFITLEFTDDIFLDIKSLVSDLNDCNIKLLEITVSYDKMCYNKYVVTTIGELENFQKRMDKNVNYISIKFSK